MQRRLTHNVKEFLYKYNVLSPVLIIKVSMVINFHRLWRKKLHCLCSMM